MLEVERTRCGDDKDIIGAALSLRDQRLKDCLRILPEGIDTESASMPVSGE